MSEEKVIRRVPGGGIQALLSKYDADLDRMVGVSNESPLPVTTQDLVVITKDFLLQVAQGNVLGHKMFSIPGRQDGLSTTILDDLTQVPTTTILPDPDGIQMEVVSSDADDTVAGAGAQQVLIQYLDTAGAEQSEIVDLDGVNPVNTVATDIDKIQWMSVERLGGGANKTAQGNIDLRDTGGAVIYERIAVGGNQSLSARYHIPIAKTGYLLGWQSSAVAKAIDFRLRATIRRIDRTLISGVFLFQDAIVLDVGSSGWIPFDAPKRCPAGSTIKISGLSTAAGGDGGGQFDILVIDD